VRWRRRAPGEAIQVADCVSADAARQLIANLLTSLPDIEFIVMSSLELVSVLSAPSPPAPTLH
jgi:hypothetical protein